MNAWNEANEAIGVFVHDMGKDMALIIGYSDYLLAQPEALTEQQRAGLESIRRSGRRIAAVMDAASAFFQLRADSEQPSAALACRLPEAVHAAIEELATQGRRFVAQTDWPADLPAVSDNGYLTLAIRLLLARIYYHLLPKEPLPARFSAAPADAGQVHCAIRVDARASEYAIKGLAHCLTGQGALQLAKIIIEDAGGALAFEHDADSLTFRLSLPVFATRPDAGNARADEAHSRVDGAA